MKKFCSLIISALLAVPLIGCNDSHDPISEIKPIQNQPAITATATELEPTLNEINNQDESKLNPSNPERYGRSAELSVELGECTISGGVPEEGMGFYDKNSDAFDLGLTFKKNGLGCDHEGPTSQSCRIDEGGYVTWLEAGERRHIKASGGYVDIILEYNVGVRCD